MCANSALLRLLKTVGSPLISNSFQAGERLGSYHDPRLYSIAEVNKIPLTYLSTVNLQEKKRLPEYDYHYNRLHRLVEVLVEISKLFDEKGINYVIFKTLKPYSEYVADIDILNTGSRNNYRKMVKVLKENGYLLMEEGTYCTTFRDYKTRFKTELMIDVYDEISVDHLIYLDKHKLSHYIAEKELPTGQAVRVFSPEAELLATIAHSAIKENQYILSEYYATLHYLALMDQHAIERLIDLVRENKLVNAFRWHLTITTTLHKIAFDSIPEKLSNLLSKLGGLWSRAYGQVFESMYPPYKCDPLTLTSIFREKMQDSVFRSSLCHQMLSFPTRNFTKRLLTRLMAMLAIKWQSNSCIKSTSPFLEYG